MNARPLENRAGFALAPSPGGARLDENRSGFALAPSAGGARLDENRSGFALAPSAGGARLLLALAPLALLAACGYQEIPRAENSTAAAWAEVENQYQRRADLVPNLVEVVKGYATHEKETLQAVVEARAHATQVRVSADQLTPENMKKFEAAQGALGGALGRLLVVAERYPDLKANENFRDLQTQLEGTENRIGIARRRYIEAVNGFNDLVTVPPTSWTNSLFYHKQPRPQFSATTAGAAEAPKVKF